ncbi:MAG: HEAT repeat domain-containing protein, partial [Planctomycetes bacterium]|nr:HEAT repeat domain-containing protein [Planctomycetota bacterium]
MIPRASRLLVLLVSSLVPTALRAQGDGPSAEARAAAATAMREWVAEFEIGRLGPRGLLHGGPGLQPRYVRYARQADLVSERDSDRITHLDMLGKLLIFAEQHPSNELTEATLAVAAAGFERAFLDQNALEVREAGHWSLMRTDDRNVWFLLLRAAAGDRSLVFAEQLPREEDPGTDGLATGPARRVAALRLLGMKNKPVFRSTIEACLWDPDPRVRLAAAEALDFQRRPLSLAKVVERVQTERHPVVSQALVRLLDALIRLPGEQPSAAERAQAVQAALRQFGLSGWRTDMELLELVERYPTRELIPVLIAALERSSAPPDKLVATVNKRASIQLRERAGGLLRAMTGALIAEDDPAAWRTFWEREQDRIEVPKVLKRERAGGTRATFFGVPVTGSSIAFLIDTSGSMEEQVAVPVAGGANRTSPTGSRPGRSMSRLGAAKEQLALAVQAMDPNSRYQ